MASLYWRPAPPETAVSIEASIEVLEIKVAHLERALQELSDVLYRHEQRLDAQETRYRQLLDRVDAAEPEPTATSFEVPPHY